MGRRRKSESNEKVIIVKEKKRGGGCLLVLLFFGFIGYAAVNGIEEQVKESEEQEARAISGIESLTPQRQKKFEDILVRFKKEYESVGDNDAKKTDVRFRRGGVIAELFKDNCKVVSWVGKVNGISTNSDGDVSFYIKLLRSDASVVNHATIIGNAFSDTHTITRNHPLYKDIMQMNEGDTVVFSGEFVPEGSKKNDEISDGIREIGALEFVVMKRPSFAIKYSSLKKK